jgi:23S rRNA (adenine-N6)-dimethyltransferase
VPGRQRPPATPPGAHFLLPRVAADIVRAARVGDGDLVFDLGAGLGALTAPLAATGARVVAVERHPGYARSLARRFDGRTGVRVVAGDLLTVPLPRRAFRVVANIPFATAAALLRRLLAPGAPPLARADLVVEYGVARRLTGPPRDGQARWWAARYDARIARRLPAACFDPPPRSRGPQDRARRPGGAARRRHRAVAAGRVGHPGVLANARDEMGAWRNGRWWYPLSGTRRSGSSCTRPWN